MSTHTPTKSAEQKGNRAYEGVASVIAALRKLVRKRRLDPGLERIDLHVKEHPQEPGVIYCKVDIKGDTKADRDAIKAKFPASEGWTCKNTGETTATCTN